MHACVIADITLLQNKQFLPKETLVYIRLVEYALQALDIYTINVTPLGLTNVRSATYVGFWFSVIIWIISE